MPPRTKLNIAKTDPKDQEKMSKFFKEGEALSTPPRNPLMRLRLRTSHSMIASIWRMLQRIILMQDTRSLHSQIPLHFGEHHPQGIWIGNTFPSQIASLFDPSWYVIIRNHVNLAMAACTRLLEKTTVTYKCGT